MKYLLFGTLLFFNLFLSYALYMKEGLNEKEKQAVQKEADILFHKNTLLQADIIRMLQGQPMLSENLSLVTEKGKKIEVRNLIRKDRYTLVLRYSYLSCSPCVDYAVTALKDFKEQHPDINVLLLSTYRQKKDLRDFKRVNKVFFHVYHVDSLNLAMDEENIPYFFMLDKDMRMFNFFMPHQEIPELTAEYFRKINSLISKNE